ncbi:DUF6461 domain-containing protein [Nocardioides sp. MH1]|uniref:DUF6461 domain-containing protein n=1 Tax=Nocardioides sp. MH1 TaxID=3242490 RepID=UPI003522F751
MAATIEYYDDLIDSFGDSESLTLLVVAGASRDCVARALDVDLHEPVTHPWDDETESDFAAWALVEIDGGVLGVEYTGYGDPTADALRAMSRGGGAAAVVRSNLDAQLRFGCARDAAVVFDAHQLAAVEDPAAVPSELRPLFQLVHDDNDEADAFVVGLAMAEVVTGLELTSQEALLLAGAQFFRGPSLLDPEV